MECLCLCAELLRPTSGARKYSAGFRFGLCGSSARRAYECDLLARLCLVPGLALDDCAPWPKDAQADAISHARTVRAVCDDEAVSERATGVLWVTGMSNVQFATETYAANSNSTETDTDSPVAIPSCPPADSIKCSSRVTATKSTWLPALVCSRNVGFSRFFIRDLTRYYLQLSPHLSTKTVFFPRVHLHITTRTVVINTG